MAQVLHVVVQPPSPSGGRRVRVDGLILGVDAAYYRSAGVPAARWSGGSTLYRVYAPSVLSFASGAMFVRLWPRPAFANTAPPSSKEFSRRG